MYAKTFAELRALSQEELLQLHDDNTKNVVVGLSSIQQEIERRENEELTREMLDISKRVERLTRISVIAAVTSLLVAIASVIVALNAV